GVAGRSRGISWNVLGIGRSLCREKEAAFYLIEATANTSPTERRHELDCRYLAGLYEAGCFGEAGKPAMQKISSEPPIQFLRSMM
ncbi:hypothetical protein, partial [Azomonas macrocytogenes]|uniref:hypothetical protein n=1 Tax=Azomonas macrocytogenes TaxID=69962 RepID=UPI001C84278B